MKRNLLFLFTSIFWNVSTADNFEGYYVELVVRYEKSDYVKSAEYLMDEKTLINFVSNYADFKNDSSLSRVFNYSGFYFERIPKEFWPIECKSQNCIDWNMKVSLHRSNYSTFHRLYYYKKSNKNISVAFHIKKVNIEIEKLGTIKEMKEKKYDLEFFYMQFPIFRNNSLNNVLLIFINAQKVLNELDIELLGLDKHLQLMDIKKANNKFHTHFTDSHLAGDKLKNARFDCFCDEYFPSNR